MSLGLVSKLVRWAFTSGIGANCWVKPVLYFSFMGFFMVFIIVCWMGREVGGGGGVVERERVSQQRMHRKVTLILLNHVDCRCSLNFL